MSLYTDSLYKLADRVKAKSIIEGGLGPGESAQAFIDSLSKRPPGQLTTVEVILSTVPRPEDITRAFARKVKWEVVYGDLQTVYLKQPCDLLYLDGPASHDGIMNAYNNLGGLVRKGGLVVVDGLGDHMIRHGHGGANEATAEIAALNHTKVETIEYAPDSALGIVVKA